jgi:hypothetical protein
MFYLLLEPVLSEFHYYYYYYYYYHHRHYHYYYYHDLHNISYFVFTFLFYLS